jgi:hypothetical protein
MTPWKCSCCGEIHDTLPNNFGFDQPYHWGDREKSPPPDGCLINPDYCVIDEDDYFIRGVLEIPVHGSDEEFVIGVWSTLSKANFVREQQMASDLARVNEPAYFGWFANQIWQYPNTLNLKCNVISREPGQRPSILLEATDHPLSVEQRNGISHERQEQLSAQFSHGWQHPDWRAVADN